MNSDELFNEFNICNYEITAIINNSRNTIGITNDLEEANLIYEKAVNSVVDEYKDSHVIIILYDYNKSTNINYFDNETDLA